MFLEKDNIYITKKKVGMYFAILSKTLIKNVYSMLRDCTDYSDWCKHKDLKFVSQKSYKEVQHGGMCL